MATPKALRKKIESLTANQEQERLEFHRKWFQIGCSTEPADFDRAEKSIYEMYGLIGKKPPEFVFRGTPATCVLAMSLLRDEKFSKVLRSSLRSSLESSLWSSLGSSLESSLRSSLESSLGSSLWSSLWSSLGSSLGSAFWGQHSSPWIGFYLFCQQVGVSYEEKDSRVINLWAEIAESCGWWWPFEGALFIADRPSFVGWDDRDPPVIHCEEGPAIAYRDGWKVWALHGVMVDEQIVMKPETQTIEQIDKELNAEVKRVRIERLGWQKYLEDTGAKCLHRRSNRVEGTREALFVTKDGMVTLVCHCPSTGRIYALEVDPSCKNCEEAQRYLMSGNSLESSGLKLNVIGRT